MKINEAIETLKHRKSTSEKYMLDFVKEIQRNPFRAMETSDRAIQESARIDIFSGVIISLDSHDSVDYMIGFCHKEALRMARFPQKSTSVTSNLMHQYQAAAFIEVAEILQGFK